MMEITKDILRIRCNVCGEIIPVFRDDLDAEISSWDHGDNGMGVETEYLIREERDCACGNIISFTIRGYEYPVGAFDFEDYSIDGGTFIDTPNMEIVYFREDFETDPYVIQLSGIQELILKLASDRQLLNRIPPRQFEEVVEQLFIDYGFSTALTPATRDGGKDIIATLPGFNGKPIVFYVECKRYAQDNKVDVGIVRSLYGVQAADKVNKVCLVTTSLFTKDARDFAEDQNVMIDLVDGEALFDMIKRSAQRYEQGFAF